MQKSNNVSDPDYAHTGSLEGFSLNLTINFANANSLGTIDTAENYYIGGLVAKITVALQIVLQT